MFSPPCPSSPLFSPRVWPGMLIFMDGISRLTCLQFPAEFYQWKVPVGEWRVRGQSLFIAPALSLWAVSGHAVFLIKDLAPCPGQVAQLVRASSYTPKGYGFNPQPGRIYRLWIWSMIWAHTGGNQFFPHIDVSLSLSPPPHTLPSLSLKLI